MSKIDLLHYPDPRLKQQGETVDIFNDEIQRIIDNMFETHYAQENCAALAATQLDFINPKRITVIDYSSNKDEPLCLVNPKIIEREGEQNEFEGCMSVYPSHIHAKVKRDYWIRVTAQDRHGNPLDFEAEGYKAKCIQHELDHLNGMIFLDRLKPFKRKMIDDKIRQVIKQLKRKI